MGTFCITRKAFLDRAMDAAELAVLADMLREWYGLRAPTGAAESARVVCAARVYAVPRPAVPAIRDALALRLPGAEVQAASPDEILATGPASPPYTVPDVSVWREVLVEPLVQNGCVILTLKIEGQVIALNGRPDDMSQTFVLCGQPVWGAILLKAIWDAKPDDYGAQFYKRAGWPAEESFLQSFEVYLRELAAGRHATAAIASVAAFGRSGRGLFTARRDQRRITRLVRQRVELPDDRNVAGFARRAGLPLAGALAFAVLPAIVVGGWPFALACFAAAGYWFCASWKIIWKKFLQVRRCYSRMRNGLAETYSNPIEVELTDLSAEHAPTFLKSIAELGAMGATHVCDLIMKTARKSFDGNRVYTIGNTIVTISLLRRAGSFLIFPAKPVVFATTRFVDGRRHATMNRPQYRKLPGPEILLRCVPDGDIKEVLAHHRARVDRMIARGAVPLPTPMTGEDVLNELRAQQEEGREAWRRSPYSWGDALHQSFKNCRRQYLAD